MIYAATIFLSAFLLFQIQLIAAKHLLPWFGGAPAVWTTCQLFFQGALLGGYAYAHWVGQIRSVARQQMIHLALLAAGLAAVVAVVIAGGHPILAPSALKPSGNENPVQLLLITLTLTTAVPFVVLSATSPLLQTWHSRTTTALDRTYRLYAVSNVGSLAGLLTYPFVFEWLIDVRSQAWLWSALFVMFVTMCALVSRKATRVETHPSRAPIPASGAASSISGNESLRGKRVLWLALPLLSSGLLLATTNQLCLEVATVPFLWVLPLTIYLLTFIVCFDRPALYWRRGYLIAAALLLVTILPVAHLNTLIPIPYQIAIYSLFLWCFCMICHGELVRLRPPARDLTRFYFLIALGGVLGAIFVGVIAPSVFDDIWEFHILLIAGWLTFAYAWRSDPASPLNISDRWVFAGTIAAAALPFAHQVAARTPLAGRSWTVNEFVFAIAAIALVAGSISAFGAWRWRALHARPWGYALVLLVVGLTGYFLHLRITRNQDNQRLIARNFFGVIRVTDLMSPFGTPSARVLLHGSINHGLQLAEKNFRLAPTAYFSPSSGIGRAAAALQARAGAGGGNPSTELHWGIVGMGIGTLSAYARPGDQVRLYEINPIVVETCEGADPLFTFVRDCAGEVEVVLGDARLALERELATGSHRFDLLAMDAFSSDAVPVHLITEEAFALYAAHLRDHRSILAVNVTNRFLELGPVIASNAARLGFQGIRIESAGDAPFPQGSSWILLARDSGVFASPSFASAAPAPLSTEQIRFTDRYSNLFKVLK